MKTILNYLEESEKKHKNKIAIIEEEKSCTYAELVEKSKRIASFLTKHTETKKPIPILMEKGINTLYSFLGAVYAGCFYVLLNPELPEVRLEAILDILEANILITDEEHYDFAKKLVEEKNIFKVEELQKEDIDEKNLSKIRGKMLDVDPLYVNFTSGSTGIPKGVVINHQTVINFIDVFTEKFEINEDDIIGNQAPFDFDVSVKDIYSALKTSATLVIIPRKLFSRPVELLDYICENKVTTLIWAVSALCLITTFHGLDYKVPSTVNKVLFSGEIMPIKHIKQWIEHLPNATFVNVYGPTEITCNCTYHIVDKELKYEKQIPIGREFENENVFLLDENNKEIIEDKKVGEICVRGSTLALGYYNNLEQTNKSFIQNPLNNKYLDLIYKTGDLGYYDKNELYFSGRKDFQIKHLGHRIELEEIEMAIEKIDGIERACTLYNESKSKIYSFYIGNIENKELHEKIKKNLPVYMIPNVLKKLDVFPMTKNGKIDRKKLKEEYFTK